MNRLLSISFAAMYRVIPMLLLSFASFACARPSYAASDLPKAKIDLEPQEGQTTATAMLAGGCFWCTEAVFEQLNGVSEVISGYAGGSKEDADYRKVSEGTTKHAEAIRITYDPSQISYGDLLRVFFTTHDPTTKDRQGPDWGKQYRSAVFFATDAEKKVAEAYIKQLDEAKLFDKPIVTTLESLARKEFYPAESYHQDYVKQHPDEPYVMANALPKVTKVREKFADQLKK